MLFNSYGFIVFFPIVVIVYFLLPKRISYLWLLAASYYFYMGWNAKYALLLLASTIITYVCGVLIQWLNDRHPDKISTKKWVVAGSFILNLAILFFFKYFNFTIESINAVLSHTSLPAVNTKLAMLLHIDWSYRDQLIFLPIGISFYTFQALGYTVDVYRGEIEAERNFFRYALFVSFFPQLVAGPIERSKNLLTQLRNPKPFSYERMCDGVMLMIWGYFLKLVIADRISIFVDNAYANVGVYDGKYLLIASMLFAIQIYCDFAGYSTIAIGAAEVMGFQLMDNFNCPYLSQSVAEFWRRWHISLGTWFKEYVYFPLGGNRKGKKRQFLNIAIVWCLTGLWHGAAICFVVWGVYYGLLLIIEKSILKKFLDRLPAFIARIYTLVIVTVGWSIFSWPDMIDGGRYLKTMFGLDGAGIGNSHTAFMLLNYRFVLLMGIIGSTSLAKRLSNRILPDGTLRREILAALFVFLILGICMAYLINSSYNPFLYFRF